MSVGQGRNYGNLEQHSANIGKTLNGENGNGKRSAYLFNLFVGIFAAIVSLLIGYMLNEISRINGVIAERGERITRLEGHNEFQDSELKRMVELQTRAEAERREIFEYLTGRKK